MCNEKNKQTNTSKCEMKFEKKNQKPHHINSTLFETDGYS